VPSIAKSVLVAEKALVLVRHPVEVTTVAIVNVSQLEQYFDADAVVNEESLRACGLVKGQIDKIKILGQGDLTKALKISANLASASAKEKIEKAGGSLELS